MKQKHSKNQIGLNIINLIKNPIGMCIPVGNPIIAILRPIVTKYDFLNCNDVNKLTTWRNRFVHSFLTEFVSTENQTAKWLVDIVDKNDNKILFMIDDLQGNTFGYMGLDFIDWNNSYCEVDAIVRGKDNNKGTMSISLLTMINWTKCQLGLYNIGVRVRSDNKALNFYQKIGFYETYRVNLHKVIEKNKICWIEDKSLKCSNISLIHMKFKS